VEKEEEVEGRGIGEREGKSRRKTV